MVSRCAGSRVAILGALLSAGTAYSWQTTAVVSGRVVTETGNGVANALVVVAPPGPVADGAAFVTYQALTDATGGYRIDGVVLGKYRVCVQTSDRELLSSCRWAAFAV